MDPQTSERATSRPDFARNKRLDSRLLDHIEPPEEVQLFSQFEELCKLYTIEPPYVARSQIELMFDVYDGRKFALFAGSPDEGPDQRPDEPGHTSLPAGDQFCRPRVKRNFSWSRLLASHRSGGRRSVVCCLHASDSNVDFCLSTSSSALGVTEAPKTTPASSDEAINTALGPAETDEPEDSELKDEVRQLIGPLMSQLRRNSSLNEGPQQENTSGLVEQHQVILDGSLDSSQISVCLWAKRPPLVELKLEAENGRRWVQAKSRLDTLRWKLRGVQQLDELDRKIARYLFSRLRAQTGPRCSRREKVTKDSLDQLVDLTKNSLNHLIDAQLLLRNKLTTELRDAHNNARSNEYDLLLRNNFNLLKIWQNIEETKRLVCFVCEPIKSSLQDLFWFNRQRSYESYSGAYSLASPLVCLDGIQVKRGLMQILEALGYLHTICKLIHRNINPRNILVVANDNWKLSGLEFAMRFESATISESASMMAHEGAGLMLRYSSGAYSEATQKALRRQKTLTKCDEFVRRPRSLLLQPDLDYLAPEIWKSAKCSHKSDIFSFGLVLGQTYDLGRHKAPISCRSSAQNYELELKKLNERRKRTLSRLVPFEMRAPLLEMLDREPNLRPSANYALQLFRRPIELCQKNEDSLMHLRSSLAYLDTCLLSSLAANNCKINNINCTSTHKRRNNYFRKVTSMANRSPRRKQTKNLHLLNLLLAGVDSLAANNNGNDPSTLAHADQEPQQQPPQQLFPQLRLQFENTFESLRQVYKSTGGPLSWPDSRSIMLSVALHRRLLDQVAKMRAELPPVYRLTGACAQANRLTQNHRLLAELEDKLHTLASQQSISKLAPILTDPLIKLDEFLLVYELLGDLLAFVGQKCRQNFIQRGKQLLNELTPLTGCPSLSSSDEEDSSHADTSTLLLGVPAGTFIGSSRETLDNLKTGQQKMSGHRFSEYEDVLARKEFRSSGAIGRTAHLPTKISVTAPSPMGSIRDMSHRASADSQALESQLMRKHRQLLHDERSQMDPNEMSNDTCTDFGIDEQNEDDSDLLAIATIQLNETHASQQNIDENQGHKSRSQLIDELLRTINDDSFNDIVDFNNKSSSMQQSAAQMANSNRPKSAIDHANSQPQHSGSSSGLSGARSQAAHRASNSALGPSQSGKSGNSPSTLDNVIRRMSTNFVQNFNKMAGSDLQSDSGSLRREKSSNNANSLYVDNQIPARRHSDNTINIPKIQVALTSPQGYGSRSCLNQRASLSASKLANKWKLTAKNSQRDSNDKLSPSLSGALGYMRRHSSGNTTGNDRKESNGQASILLLNASPFKTKSSSNLGLDFLLSNKSMKRRCSAASMLGHQTQRKAENLIDAGMKSVQNMFG